MALTIRKDVFLIFRALCKLSMKANSEGDPFAIRGKMLSLELIKVLLQNAGPPTRTSTVHLGHADLQHHPPCYS